MPKYTYFNKDWLNPDLHPDWSTWLREVPGDKSSALCHVCSKKFNLSNMAITSIKSHSSGKKHVQNLAALQKTVNISDMFRNKSSDVGSRDGTSAQPCIQPVNQANSVPEAVSQPAKLAGRVSLSEYGMSNIMLKKEVIWCLSASSAHLSNRQAECIAKSFPLIFEDSPIAQKFGVGKDKLGYMVNHGLFPHFKEKLYDDISSAEFIAVSFDEALNKVAQKTQMDVHVRYVNTKTGLTETRYLDSEFLLESKSSDLLRHFKNVLCEKTRMDKIVSVSMDGPAVNWAMLRELKLDIAVEFPNGPQLIEFGSCALHVVHGSLKTGHASAKWDIVSYLRNSYYFFSGFPSRKAQFTKITGSTYFPPKFCQTRWCLNASASKSAQEIYPNMVKFVESKVKMPSSKIFSKLSQMIDDPFLPAKLGFFNGLSSQLERFLLLYQSDRPLLPFLYDDLFHLVKSLLKRVLKSSLYEKIITASDIFKLKLDSSVIYIDPKDLDLFNSAKAGLKMSPKTKDVKQMTKFKSECLEFLKGTIMKLLERSPLKFSVTKGMSCLSPEIILRSSTDRVDLCIDKFMELNRISGEEGDMIKEDYCKIRDNRQAKKMMESFDKEKNRLDQTFLDLASIMNLSNAFKRFVNIILINFHGNAGVERGFSVNKHCLAENLHEESLVARRMLCEQVSIAGGPQNIVLDNSLLLSCKNANARWKDNLKRKRDEQEELNNEKLKKRRFMQEIAVLEADKSNIMRKADQDKSCIDEQIAKIRNSIR